MSDMLPCPFCGSSELHVYKGHLGDKVQCFGCHVSGVSVKIWNRRAELRQASIPSDQRAGEVKP